MGIDVFLVNVFKKLLNTIGQLAVRIELGFQNRSVDGGALGDSSVRIKVGADIRFYAGEPFEHCRNLRHECRTADEHNRVQLSEFHIGLF